MKTSWKKCIEFSNVAQQYLVRTEHKESKFSYALKRMLTRIQKQQEVVNEALADIEIEHCVTENEVITRDKHGSLQYTKDGLRQRNKATRAYLNENNVELEPYFATELPQGLTDLEIEAFSGFVISDQDVEQLLSPKEQDGKIQAVAA